MEGQLGMHLFGRLVERGVVPRSVYRGVEELLRRYREGRMEREQMVLESVAAFVACLAGVDVGIVEAHAAQVWREQSGALMAYVPEFVGLLRDRGFTCFVVSASPDVIVRHVAETLELDGYRYAYQELVVEVVATEALGPEEARRYLGRIGESVPLRGPVVLVRARLPDEFVADGVPYRYIDGMGGTVEIEVESERVIDALIPGLRRL